MKNMFNRDFDSVVRRYDRMRKDSPRHYKEAIEAFKDMAAGGLGPYEYVNHKGARRVRGLYFDGWPNHLFSDVLKALGEEAPDDRRE